MRVAVLLALYVVVIASLLYAVGGVYVLVSLWAAKIELGTTFRSIASIAGVIVLGAGVPYCLIRYIKK